MLSSNVVSFTEQDQAAFLAAKGVGGNTDGSYFEFGNNQHNHEKLLELFINLWNFSRRMRVPVNEIDFEAAFFDGPRRVIFEILWFEADDWSTVEDMSITAEKYGEWTGLITRAAETVAYTIKYPHRLMRIESITWLNFERFAITYIESNRL